MKSSGYHWGTLRLLQFFVPILLPKINQCTVEPLPWWRLLAPLIAFVLLAAICCLWRLRLLRTVFLCCVMTVVYAVLQDQFSARICPEYFTIGHPRIPNLTNPTLVGLAWGFLGGFPGGIVLGIPVALAANLGPWPRSEIRDLIKPLSAVLLFAAVSTLLTGLSVWRNGEVVNISVGPEWFDIPLAQRRAFFIVSCAHFSTYISLAIGGLALCVEILRRRRERPLHN